MSRIYDVIHEKKNGWSDWLDTSKENDIVWFGA